MKIHVRENWYRDVWLLAITGLLAAALFAFQHTLDQQKHLTHETRGIVRENRELAAANRQTSLAACANIRAVAAIAADTLKVQIHTNKSLIPRANIPGISHAELVKLSRDNERRERRHLHELRTVAHASCIHVAPTPGEEHLGRLKIESKHGATSTTPGAGSRPTGTTSSPVRGHRPTARTPSRAPQRTAPGREPAPAAPIAPPTITPPVAGGSTTPSRPPESKREGPLGLPCVEVLGHEVACH